MTFFSSLAWTGISFLLFTVLVAVISAWKTRDEQLDTAEGYFLAGRGLPGVVIAGSLLLTNLSAEQLVGLNGQSWKTNMGPIAWEVGSMFTLLVLAYYFLPKYLKMGAMTIPSLMEERYGKGTKTMFSLVIVVMYSILNLPVILYSGAVVFEQIFDISGILGTSKFMAVAILCLIIGIIGMPASLLFDPDSFYYGVLPVLAQTAEGFGVAGVDVGRAAILGQMTIGFPVSPLTASTFLLVGLSGVDFGEHQKKTIPLAWLVSLVMVVVAILTRGIAI